MPPLKYVVGDRWLAGTIALYSPDKPKPYFEKHATASPWIKSAAQTEWRYSIWDAKYSEDFPTEVIKRFPSAIILPVHQFNNPYPVNKLAPVQLGVAMLPPH